MVVARRATSVDILTYEDLGNTSLDGALGLDASRAGPSANPPRALFFASAVDDEEGSCRA